VWRAGAVQQERSGFTRDQDTGGGVPRSVREHDGGVGAAFGYPGQTECGRAEHADPFDALGEQCCQSQPLAVLSLWSACASRTNRPGTMSSGTPSMATRVAIIAQGRHVADVVPSGELDRLHETIVVLSDTDLVRDPRDGLADAHAGRVFTADQVAADLAARRDAGE
jgi:hypothetical protein